MADKAKATLKTSTGNDASHSAASHHPVTAPHARAANVFIGSAVAFVLAVSIFAVVFWQQKDGKSPLAGELKSTTQTASHERRSRMTRQAGSALGANSGSLVDAPVEVLQRDGSHSGGKVSKIGGSAGGFGGGGEPSPIDPQVQKAMELIDGGQVPEAVEVLAAVLKENPRNEQALVEMAMVHLLDLKNNDQAINYLQRAVDVNPSNQVVIAELTSLYAEEQRTDAGLTYLTEQAARHPESTDLAYGVGQMLLGQARDTEALPYLEKAIQGPQADLHAYQDLAEVYARTGEPERAVDVYSKALSLLERNSKEKAAAGLPTNYDEERINHTKIHAARAMISSGQFDRAQVLLDDVGQAMPDNPDLAKLQDDLRRRRG